MANIIVTGKKHTGDRYQGEMTIQFPCKREDVMYAALAAGHENPEYEFVSYSKLAGVVQFQYIQSLKRGFRIYATGVENIDGHTDVTIKVIEMHGYVRNTYYQKHIDYMIGGITKHLKELLKNKL